MNSDPFTLELFKNSLFSISDEMAVTICRTTYSGVLRVRSLPPEGAALPKPSQEPLTYQALTPRKLT